jgi:hypothetical protein
VQSPAPVREAVGWPFTTTAERAESRARAEARGSVVLGRQEKILGVRPAWMPVHVAWMSVAEAQRKRGRNTVVSRQVVNRYDGLTHSFLGGVPSAPVYLDLGCVACIGELVRPAKIAPAVMKAIDAAMKVTSDAAKARHAQKLAGLGVPWPCVGLSVERVDPTWWPLWVALLEVRGVQRLVVVDGRTGAADPRLSAVLTSAMSHVRDALR